MSSKFAFSYFSLYAKIIRMNMQKNLMTKNKLVIAVAIIIIVAIGFYFFDKKTAVAPEVSAPQDNLSLNNANASSSTSTLVTKGSSEVASDPWTAFDDAGNALKDADATAYNGFSFRQVGPKDLDQFHQMAPLIYKSYYMNLKKSDYVNHWQDNNQAIYFTTPARNDSTDSYGYSERRVMFVKTDNSWKVLAVSFPAWSILKASSTGETADQVEQKLQSMMKDSDQDGVIDNDENCLGPDNANGCVKTDPSKRDTNGNGWWDGIEDFMR